MAHDPRSTPARRPRFPIALALAAALLLNVGAASAVSIYGPLTPDHDAFDAKTFYRVTMIDPRLCPSPLCGGFFVERVNRRKTRCADGSKARQCHAAIVDLSALGLSAQDEAWVLGDFGAKRVLIRGELELRNIGLGLDVPTLVAEAAWRGVTGTIGDKGRFHGLRSSGIVCITHPCPSFLSYPLNTRRVRFLHGVDFGDTDATAADEQEGLNALYGDGLIGFGRRERISGPAGMGYSLSMTEFYTEIEPSGPQACGGLTWPPNPPCDFGEFCEKPAGTCNIADLPGTCQTISQACFQLWDPVCGCNGVTYGNDCERRQAGVSLDHPGVCGSGTACGVATCGPGLVCCNPVMGICTPPGGVCTQ